MDGNPYASFVALMQRQGEEYGPTGDSQQAGLGAVSARMRLGTVLTTAPLTVRVAGLTQPAAALRINERLVKGAKWKTKTISPDSDYSLLSGAVTGQIHSDDTVIDEAVVEQLKLDLEPGDEVLLLTEDDQVFFIIMKVVPA